MTATAARETTDPAVTKPGRRARWHARWQAMSPRRRGIVGVAIALLAVLAVTGGVYAWWLGGGLLRVYTTAQAKADVAQKQLNLVQKRLKAGDEAGAERHLRIADKAVTDAQAVARAPQVRVAKWLPYTRGTVADLDHLLKAASVVIDSANDAVTLYTELSGDTSKLFQRGKVNVDALMRGRTALRNMQAALTTARSELLAVDGGGPLGDEALKKRKTGLKQIREIRAEIKPYAPMIEALPSALGAEGTKRYLVAVMNPAELRGSGGAPLSVALVVLKKGKLTIPIKGTTSSVTLGSPKELQGDSPELKWKRVAGDPFQPPLGEPQRFVNMNFNPDFRVSGDQLMRATPSFFGMPTDGVIAIDVVALSKLLGVIGPIQSDYGTLTADNLVDELLVKAYQDQGGDIVGRQKRNDQLMSNLLSTLMEGGGLRAKADALLSAAPSRHFQLFFRDPRLQKLVLDRDLGGAIPSPKVGNLMGVYTQNGNGSKLDVFQQRTVDETIQMHEDGSATVRRTVRIDNPTPPYTGIGPDIKRGYNTRWATNLIINLMPPGAKVVEEPQVAMPLTVKKGVDQAGRTFAQAAVQASPNGAAELSWVYELPRAAMKDGTSWKVIDHVVAQNAVNPFLMRTTVVAPQGWTVHRVDDSQLWYTSGGTGYLQVSVDSPQTLQVYVTPPQP